MTIAQRLAQKMKDKGWSEGELSRRSSVPQPTINRIISGESQSPRRPNVEKLAKALTVSPEWLLFGGPLDSNVEPGPAIKGRVPLISWVQAGDWSSQADVHSHTNPEEWLPCPVRHGPRSYALRIRGESMNNPNGRQSFREGDLIYVDPDRQPINGSLVVVKIEGSNETTFKKLIIEGDERYLKALNPAWPSPIIPMDETVTICGVAIFKGEPL